MPLLRYSPSLFITWRLDLLMVLHETLPQPTQMFLNFASTFEWSNSFHPWFCLAIIWWSFPVGVFLIGYWVFYFQSLSVFIYLKTSDSFLTCWIDFLFYSPVCRWNVFFELFDHDYHHSFDFFVWEFLHIIFNKNH